MGIQLTGNFGFFNLVTAVLCVPLLDSQSSVFQQGVTGLTAADWVRLVLLLPLLLCSAITFLFNSWVAASWFSWPSLLDVPLRSVCRVLYKWYVYLLVLVWVLVVVTWVISFLRRILHAYGVFPPNSPPPVRFVPVWEGTADPKGKVGCVWTHTHDTRRVQPRLSAGRVEGV